MASNTTAGWVGYVAAGISIAGFGTNFVPVKKFETGDGIFFQWIMGIAIWLCGLVLQIIRGSQFQPFAMLGGVLWSTGNVMAVPIIQLIGLGLGLLMWGLTSMIVGWGVATLGLFGLTSQRLTGYPLYINIGGAFVAACAMIPYAFVKPEVAKKEVNYGDSYSNIHGGSSIPLINEEEQRAQASADPFAFLSPTMKKVLGVVLSLLSGTLYGLNFDPPQYLIDHNYGPSNSLDYVFSHFCGILATNTFWLILYSIWKRNKPTVYADIILPGMASGFLWAAAQISWFLANGILSQVITFPIISTGPGAVGALIAIFVFGEIKGARNYIFVAIAFTATLLGIGLIVTSKELAAHRADSGNSFL